MAKSLKETYQFSQDQPDYSASTCTTALREWATVSSLLFVSNRLFLRVCRIAWHCCQRRLRQVSSPLHSVVNTRGRFRVSKLLVFRLGSLYIARNAMLV